MEDLMTLEQTAEMLGVKPDTLRVWIREDRAPKHYRLTRRNRLFSRRLVLEWLETHETK